MQPAVRSEWQGLQIHCANGHRQAFLSWHLRMQLLAAPATNMALVRKRREPPCLFKRRAAARRTTPR
jgi:hypothetical protein